jgi:hypothetical protein
LPTAVLLAPMVDPVVLLEKEPRPVVMPPTTNKWCVCVCDTTIVVYCNEKETANWTIINSLKNKNKKKEKSRQPGISPFVPFSCLLLMALLFVGEGLKVPHRKKWKNTFIAVMYIYLILGGIGKCLLLVLAGVLLLLLLLYCFRLGFFNFDPLGRRTLEEEVGGEGSLFAPPMLVVVVLFVSVVVVVVIFWN